MLTVAAFILALGLLIAVHEYGHYRVAVACKVRVLRFSIGFGKPLVCWKSKNSSTEFVLGMFPLGGFVKMLDEREAPVVAGERHLAFNNQSLGVRAAIVSAGPMANLLLAILLYSVVNWSGMQYPAAILASPELGSIAAKAGLVGGERVEFAGFEGDSLEAVESFEDLRWHITRGALERRDVHLRFTNGERGRNEVVLRLGALDTREVDAELFRKVGIVGPFSRPVIGEVLAGGAADKAGLRSGDWVRQVGAVSVVDGQQLRAMIRASLTSGVGLPAEWRIEREGVDKTLLVTPEPRQEGPVMVGKIGAYVGAMPETVMVRYGAAEGLLRGMRRTGEVAVLTLRMMGQMLVGEASLKNLSGPLTIADYAGKSASMGISEYLLFLALISVSLGVLNLLPLPVLDGGHLMYYLWEGVTGKPITDIWMERLQRGGVAVLLVMMSIALFNDITRLFG